MFSFVGELISFIAFFTEVKLRNITRTRNREFSFVCGVMCKQALYAGTEIVSHFQIFAMTKIEFF